MSSKDGVDDGGKYKENDLANMAGINETTEEYVNRVFAEYDEFNNLILLLHQVNEFEPREQWIVPILGSRECQDLRTQLLTAIEDFEERRE